MREDRRPAADCGILQDAPVWNTASIACACVLAALAALVGAGTLLAHTCKDKFVRVNDPRTKATAQEAKAFHSFDKKNRKHRQ